MVRQREEPRPASAVCLKGGLHCSPGQRPGTIDKEVFRPVRANQRKVECDKYAPVSARSEHAHRFLHKGAISVVNAGHSPARVGLPVSHPPESGMPLHNSRWSRRPHPCALQSDQKARAHEGVRGTQEGFVEIREDLGPPYASFPLAGRVWVVQCEPVAFRGGSQIHSQPGSTSSSGGISGGILAVATTIRSGLRRALSLGLRGTLARPFRAHRFGGYNNRGWHPRLRWSRPLAWYGGATRGALFGFLLALITFVLPVSAHELRPAYLELHEETPGEFSVLWKTPMRGEMRLALEPEFSGRTATVTPIVTRQTKDAAVQTWRLRAVEPLPGQTVQIRGLNSTMTDALVRIEFADGNVWVLRLTPQEPAASVPERQNGWSVAGVYLKLGVEHILLGIDHLLFVLALLILTRRRFGVRRVVALSMPLMKTVTAFTVAHSITLGLATLGFVRVPSKPIEAVIALSIVFVAVEIVHARQGRLGITAKAPWIVAFSFGLLHGFGFAGALSEVGLPPGHIPVALLFFNVGVEVGQLFFIAAVLTLVTLIRCIRIPLPRWAELAPPYAIGSIAMFWVLQRVVAF